MSVYPSTYVFLVLLMFGVAKSENFIYKECRVHDEEEMTQKMVTNDHLDMLLSSTSESVEIIVKQEHLTNLSIAIEIEVPAHQWLAVRLHLKDDVYITLRHNGSEIPPADAQRSSVIDVIPKYVTVKNATEIVTSCHQGLPFKKLAPFPFEAVSFPSFGDETDEVYLLLPMLETAITFLTKESYKSRHPPIICWNEIRGQLEIQKDHGNCNGIPPLRYHWLNFHHSEGKVTVMSKEGQSLGELHRTGDDRVEFSPKNLEGDVYVIQCQRKDCQQLLADDPIATSPITARKLGTTRTLVGESIIENGTAFEATSAYQHFSEATSSYQNFSDYAFSLNGYKAESLIFMAVAGILVVILTIAIIYLRWQVAVARRRSSKHILKTDFSSQAVFKRQDAAVRATYDNDICNIHIIEKN